MTRRLALLLALPVLLLVGCTPTSPIAGTDSPAPSQAAVSTPAASASQPPVATPTPTPVPTATAVSAADYLIHGHPHQPDANGDWYAEYAFFTDDTKTVWCEFVIFSGDQPASYCEIAPTAKSQATYQLPSWANGKCQGNDAGLDRDGYALGLLIQPLSPKVAGWAGCSNGTYFPTKDLAKTKVLPDGAVLKVSPFKCTTLTGVGTCSFHDSASVKGSITLGLNTASWTSVP